MKEILLIFLIFSASLAQAALIDYSSVKLLVDERGETAIQHLISYDSRNGEEVSFRIFDKKNLRVFDNLGELEFVETTGVVSFSPRDFVENYGVTIEYTSSMLTSKNNEQWDFELIFENLNDYTGLKFELALPTSIALASHNPQAIVFSGEKNLELEWSFEDVQEPVILNASYFFSGNTEPEPPDDMNLIFLLGLFIAVAAVIGIGGAIYYFSQKKGVDEIKIKKEEQPVKKVVKENLTEGQRDLMKMLNENEEKVVKELLKEDNIAQRNLMARVNLPKSTLSRTLKKLELKGLIRVINIGVTNKIELSKEFKEK